MAANAGTATIGVRGDFSPFNRQMGRFSVTTRSQFAKVGKLAGAGFAVGLATAGVAAKKSITAAVKLGEQINKTRVVFRGSEKDILRWSKTTATAIGTSRREALEAAGTFGNMLVPMGFARKEAGKMSTELVKLGADLASFNNASPQETLDALRAGLAGETEPLRRFGIFLNDARLKQEALNLGLKDAVGPTGALNANAKAQATYSLILKDSKDAQGDFTRTSKSLANQQRILKAQVEDLSASAGKVLLPALTKAAGATSKFLKEVQTGTGTGGEFARTAKEIGEAILPIAKFAGNAAVNIGKFAAKHPQLTAMATSAGLIAAAFSKLKLGKGLIGALTLLRGGRGGLGGGGGLGGVIGSAKPVPVFVTNPGFAGGGRGPGGAIGPKGPVSSAPKTPFGKLPAGVRGAVGSTAVGLGALKITTDFFKDKSDIGLLNQFASAIERVAKAGDAEGMRKLAKDMRAVADANKDQTKGEALRAFAAELDRTADRGGKDINGIIRLFGRLDKHTKSDLDAVGRRLKDTGNKTRTFGSRQAFLADQSDKAEARVRRLRTAIGALGGNLKGTGSNVDALRAKLERLKSRYDVEILLQLQARGPANLSDRGFPRPRRKGGLVFQAGGLVPAMVSPGEMGILPDGGTFKVPGPRTAADSVPMSLPPGTSILTDSGQNIFRRTGSVLAALMKQRPHFQGGGVVGRATQAGTALRKAGIRGEDSLITLLATAGRESRWNKRAKGGPNSNGTFDWGFLQANDIWANDPVIRRRRLWDKRLTWDGGAQIAKRILDAQGWSAWRLSGPGHNSTIDPFWGTAAKAFNRSKGGIGSGGRMRVTPAAISHPILSTQLRPLVDDALLRGIEEGREGTGHRGRVDLLTEVLEGIVPESGDRATRERLTGGGGGGGASGPIATRITKGISWLKSVDAKNLGYQYGGGHGTIGVGNPSFDCSGYVSGGLGAMGLLKSPLTSVTLGSWGKAGEGRNVTVGTRGGAGMSGHTMMAAKDPKTGKWRFFESGGGHGPQETSGWNGSFSWRHPTWRTGGVVGMRKGGMLPPTKKGQRHLEQLARRKRTSVADLLNPQSKNFVGWGFRGGGIVGIDPDTLAELFEQAGEEVRQDARLVRGGRRAAGLFQLINLIGQDQLGSERAQTVTRRIAQRVQGRSTGALVGAQQRIKRQIRRMARHGFTGPERIRTRRLRGALSLIQDELGRPIGRALGRSDRLQELIDRRQSTLADRLTVMGVDPESAAGLGVQRSENITSISRLERRKRELQKALKRARRTGDKRAVKAVQAEITEVDDQILGLRASIINLDKAIKENTDAAQDAIREQQLEQLKQIADLAKENDARQKRIELALSVQGQALPKLLEQMFNGVIGGNAGLGRSFPSFTGSGGLARL